MIRPLLRPLLAAVVVLTATAAASAFQVTVVPTDAQLPGTQSGELTFTIKPYVDCTGCHKGFDLATEPARPWEGSMMAHAGRDPLFWAAMSIAEQNVAGSGDLCIRCHSPGGWLNGNSTPTDGSALIDNNLQPDRDGVSCDICHRMVNPDTSGFFGWQNPPFLAHDGSASPEGFYGSGEMVMLNDLFAKVGPYDDAAAPHVTFQSTFLRSSNMCGTCHDVSNPFVGDLAPGNGSMTPLAPGEFSGVPGAPVSTKAAFKNPPHKYGIVERTFSEHQASAFASMPVAAYASLPLDLKKGALEAASDAAFASNSPTGNYIDGTTRTFSCQTCHMPPASGKGCILGSAPVRDDVPFHDLTGGNTFAPAAIAWLDANNGLQLGGGLSTGDLASLAAGVLRAEATLERAAALSTYGDAVRVTNLTGHKLTSGYPEGRRMWLHVTWKDLDDNVVREDGAYGPITTVINGVLQSVDSIQDLADPNLHLFEVQPGLSPTWAAELIGMGTSASTPITYDRNTGAVTKTLSDVAADPLGVYTKSFHFVLNDQLLSDNRIPPYGMTFNQALERNASPVPDTQFGNPGPGGTYEHWAEVALSPPAGALSAEIELLYQTVSWEYVQFLHEANDGSITYLANEGEDLLDAWLATGMSEPHVMATTNWFASSPYPWTDLQNALQGAVGIAELTGSGSVLPGESVGISIQRGLPGANVFFVLGAGQLLQPLKGGVLVPTPDVILDGLKLNNRGSLSFVFPWPALPSGLPVYMQAWFVDQGGPFGFSASNGLSATTP